MNEINVKYLLTAVSDCEQICVRYAACQLQWS